MSAVLRTSIGSGALQSLRRPAVLTAAPTAGPSSILLPARPTRISRPISSSSIQLKKSKAAAAKRHHQEVKHEIEEDMHENPDGHRYQAPANDNVDMVHKRIKEKMRKATDWAKAQVYEGVERVSGKVSPSLLDSVRVTIEGSEGSHPLNSVAAITVKHGALWVDVWDIDSMKPVESALNAANLPGMSPSRMSDTSLRLPVVRPTHEQRQEILKRLGQIVEDAKNQVRRARAEGMNSLGGRGEPGTEEIQKMADEYGHQLVENLNAAKKQFDRV